MRKKRILQLCGHSNLFGPDYKLECIDLRAGRDVLNYAWDYGQKKKYDLILSGPPCDQFTKANSLNWIDYPDYFVRVAKKCFEIQVSSGCSWLLENPPGRIEKFIPELTKYRLITWHGNLTNKEYVLYGNILLLSNYCPRYGKKHTVSNMNKYNRELWQIDFINFIKNNL